MASRGMVPYADRPPSSAMHPLSEKRYNLPTRGLHRPTPEGRTTPAICDDSPTARGDTNAA